MNKLETLKAFLRGEPVERCLASFWGHFYHEEQHWEKLLEKTVMFQETFHWDFVKINPSSIFFLEDWGNRYRKYDDRHQDLVDFRVKQVRDFLSLEEPGPREGVRGDHLRLIKGLRGRLPDTPLVMTLFNPLSYAHRLCGGPEVLKRYLGDSPDTVFKGLELIFRSVAAYATECLREGCDGFFYATTEWGDGSLMDRETYEKYSRTFDVELLKGLREKSLFLILHVCKGTNRLRDLLDYPVDAFSWDWKDRSNPSPGEIKALTERIIMGGITQGLLSDEANMDMVRKEVGEFKRETSGHRAVLAPGCTFHAYHEGILKDIRGSCQ
ncbi:MAG: uroporphyrinogen decarboxylase family protein [Candidatus Eremiobacteraeota bacterium]|nr:uroporphyrinogen decarboxylase family protein [Candidatus Eremiobacteraeota bacterium]